jgi:hypothetical protein
MRNQRPRIGMKRCQSLNQDCDPSIQALVFDRQPPTRKMIRARIPGLICGTVLCCILMAGLAPFERPRKAVTWLGNENGVRFGQHGTIWSSGTFVAADAQGEPSCSLEIWLQPDSTSASSTLLAFYTPEDPQQFLLQQYHALLILTVFSGGSSRYLPP